jgi:hypothetical protein
LWHFRPTSWDGEDHNLITLPLIRGTKKLFL